MNTFVLIGLGLMLPLGIVLRLRYLRLILGVLILGCALASVYHLYAAGPGSMLILGGPIALLLMLGWTIGGLWARK